MFRLGNSLTIQPVKYDVSLAQGREPWGPEILF